jgi:hypothetical protein
LLCFTSRLLVWTWTWWKEEKTGSYSTLKVWIGIAILTFHFFFLLLSTWNDAIILLGSYSNLPTHSNLIN